MVPSDDEATSSDREQENPVMNTVHFIDRNHAIYVPALRFHFPAPALFDEADPTGSDQDNKLLWGSAPWYNRDALNVVGLMEHYVGDDDYLPNGIPLGSIRSWCWRHQFSVRAADLKIPYGRTLESVRGDFALAVNNGLNRLRSTVLIEPELGVDMFVYRTQGEVAYVDSLNELTAETIEGWRDSEDVDQRALLMDRPQMRVDFRFHRKVSSYWKDGIRGERRARSVTGLAIPYHILTQFNMTNDAKGGGFPLLTLGWGKVEVPRGCYAELPPVFSYKIQALMDRRHGLWVVAYTGFAAKVACFLIQEVYDHYRLWALSAKMIENIRALDLIIPLGSQHNVDEVRRLLTVIENTDFSRYPSSWAARGTRAVDYSPGRRASGADYIYYDPWCRRMMSDSEHTAKMRESRRRRPVGYPTGYDFSEDTSGWFDDNGNEIPYVPDEDGDFDASGGWGDAAIAAQNNANVADDDEPEMADAVPAPVDNNINIARDNGSSGYNPFGGVSGSMPNPMNTGMFPSTPNMLGNNFFPPIPGVINPGLPVGYPPQPNLTGYGGNGAFYSVGPMYDLEVIRKFLRDVGVNENTLTGSYAELRGYLRGGLGL